MRFTVIAVAAGLVIGLLGGGSIRRLGQRSFLWWPLLPIGVLLQTPFVDRLGFAGLLASYACLLAFALANLRLTGMGLVAIGIAMNIVPIVLNRGMPVNRDAIVTARIADAEHVDRLETDRKHHLERSDDRLTVLSDILPVPPLREVLSFGDIVLSVGVADVLFHLLRRPPRHVEVDGDNS